MIPDWVWFLAAVAIIEWFATRWVKRLRGHIEKTVGSINACIDRNAADIRSDMQQLRDEIAASLSHR